MSCERLFRPDLRTTPVVVLSNNDGCVVSRSNEAKAIGVRMGQPWFECKALTEEHGILALSSNYALYADLSNRVMNVLSTYSPRTEVYSIDECFVDLTGTPVLIRCQTPPIFNLHCQTLLSSRLAMVSWFSISVWVVAFFSLKTLFSVLGG